LKVDGIEVEEVKVILAGGREKEDGGETALLDSSDL